MHILIIANGPLRNPASYKKIIERIDYVISCNGGYSHAHKLGVEKIDCAIGDFDSISERTIKAKRITSFPSGKDKTDFELAVEFATSKNPKKISVIGAIGDRQDHTWNTIFAIARFPDIEIILYDEFNEIFVIQNNTNILRGNVGQKISFIPLELPIKTISSVGLRYPLSASWFNEGKLSISNEFSKDEALVTLEGARFIVIKVLKKR